MELLSFVSEWVIMSQGASLYLLPWGHQQPESVFVNILSLCGHNFFSIFLAFCNLHGCLAVFVFAAHCSVLSKIIVFRQKWLQCCPFTVFSQPVPSIPGRLTINLFFFIVWLWFNVVERIFCCIVVFFFYACDKGFKNLNSRLKEW